MHNRALQKKSKRFIELLINHKIIVCLLIFVIACYPIFFFRLHLPSIRMWDESRRAINAFEMTINGNWLVTHYDGKPEMVGTKPPLLIWCIALSMKVFGYNEFALRLPSAVCAMSTTIIIFLALLDWLWQISNLNELKPLSSKGSNRIKSLFY